MKQIRNLAISGVDTLEKANKVCEIVGDAETLDQMNYEEFLEKYDSKELKQIIDNPDVNSLANKSDDTDKSQSEIKREMEKDSLPEKPKEDMTMKELYETGKYTCYTNPTGFYWVKNESPNFTNPSRFEKNHTHKLILKEHEHIADAVIANPSVKIEWTMDAEDLGWSDITDFFNTYDKKMTYRLAKPQCDGKFNGGYIKASQEAYDLLVEAGYKTGKADFILNFDYFIVGNGSRTSNKTENTFYSNATVTGGYKQFYINNGKLSWDEPIHINNNEFLESHGIIINDDLSSCSNISIKATDSDGAVLYEINNMEDLNELPIIGEEDGNNSVSNNDDNCSNDSGVDNLHLSIKDDNGKEYSFEKPEFECELLKVVKDKIVGYYLLDDSLVCVCAWSINGESAWDTLPNLTPIKAKWYEEESNFPALLIDLVDNETMLAAEIDGRGYFKDSSGHTLCKPNEARLATKEEVNSLYYDKE